MKIFGKVNRSIRCLLLAACLVGCGSNSVEKFHEAMAVGNLSEAQEYLAKIDDRRDCKTCALQLIQTYLEVDAPEKSIYVYEYITPWHKDRYDMKWGNGDYEREVCKLLRSYLVKNGEYEKAQNYYPLEYEDENYIGNAQSHYMYVSDVVADLCDKGKQDEAYRFVEYQLRWFVANVDSDTSTLQSCIDTKAAFNSTVVREKLLEQIDNSY